MSLMSTLAKVAVGVAVAKGVGHMMKKSGNPTGTTGAGGLFEGQESAAQQTSGGGLENLVGSVLGGSGRSAEGGASGGLGGLLEQLSGRTGGGGLNGVLGSLTGGSGSGGGGLGSMLGAIGGGSGSGGGLGGLLSSLGSAGGGAAAGGLGGLLGVLSSGSSGSPQGSFGEVLNSAFTQNDTPEITPSAEQEVAAALMLRAMIQAAKSDGKLDDAERDKLLGKLGDASPGEIEFVQAELQAPLDVDGLAGQVPAGLEAQVYAMSVMAIDLDSQAEAQYLDRFAKSLGLPAEAVNDIHGQLGVPALYA
ncbi:MAG: tellurite resistance TerB family protein [Pseudomonadota bacterium]